VMRSRPVTGEGGVRVLKAMTSIGGMGEAPGGAPQPVFPRPVTMDNGVSGPGLYTTAE
jgi:hypothetical protein